MSCNLYRHVCSLCQLTHLEDEILNVGYCAHKVCGECLVDYITNNLTQKVYCPIQGCDAYIFDPIIRQCLSNDQILKYECLSSNMAKKCPISECPFLYFSEQPFGSYECEYCESPICSRCNDVHYPERCGDNYGKVKLHKKAVDIIKRKKREESQIIEKNKLFGNPEAFTCSICTNYILPRAGAILRNCLHSFCMDCLKDTYSDEKFMRNLKCQTCDRRLDAAEISVLFEEGRIFSMMLNEGRAMFYNCKTPDCSAIWHVAHGTTSHTCPTCTHVNCMICLDIHEEMSCDQFQSQRGDREMRTPQERNFIFCFYCKIMLAKDGQRSTVCCVNCRNYTCVFKGLLAGTHNIMRCGCMGILICDRKDQYCGCTEVERCHVKCRYVCTSE